MLLSLKSSYSSQFLLMNKTFIVFASCKLVIHSTHVTDFEKLRWDESLIAIVAREPFPWFHSYLINYIYVQKQPDLTIISTPHQIDQAQPINKGVSRNWPTPIQNPFHKKGPCPQHWFSIVPEPGKIQLSKKRKKETTLPVLFIVTNKLSINAMPFDSWLIIHTLFFD